jgi:hypothetical protein
MLIEQMPKKSDKVTLVEYRRDVANLSEYWWKSYRNASPGVMGEVDAVIRECHKAGKSARECHKMYFRVLTSREFNPVLLESERVLDTALVRRSELDTEFLSDPGSSAKK